MKKICIYILPLFLIILSFFFEKSLIYSALIVYFLDAGHVYSTLLESHFDFNHERRLEIYGYTGLAFIINFLILSYFKQYFFAYIFYFTVFHNMRQGLGFVLMSEGIVPPWIIKSFYYIGTMIPFLLFHMREITSELSMDILYSIDMVWLNDYINYDKLRILYFSFLAFSILFLIVRKEYNRLIPFIWFSLIYLYAWILSESQIQSYFILVISHAIPYFWIMKDRIYKTHNIKVIAKYSGCFLLILFCIGGVVDYLHDGKSIGSNIVIEALFFTPLITHFFIDGIFWKRKDKRFNKLMEYNRD